jgi:hypothetical protein
MTVWAAHDFARAARGEALRVVRLADEIVGVFDPDQARPLADEMMASADQCARDARTVRAQLVTPPEAA